jgi:hypothetical protein
MTLNTARLKVACIWIALIYYCMIIPLHITAYLFEINHNSIKSSSGIGESYPILTIVWIFFHAVSIISLWVITNRIKWLFSKSTKAIN